MWMKPSFPSRIRTHITEIPLPSFAFLRVTPATYAVGYTCLLRKLSSSSVRLSGSYCGSFNVEVHVRKNLAVKALELVLELPYPSDLGDGSDPPIVLVYLP